MRVRFFTVLTALALAVAVVAAFGTGAGARPSAKPAAAAKAKTSARPAHVQGTIYSQRDNDNGIGIVSQNFEATYDAYDSQGADDFKIKNSTGATVKRVFVDGVYFGGVGPANNIHVTFYKNASGHPGAVKKDYPTQSYSDLTGTGTFSIPIPGLKLAKGTYWVSVYVNMDFGVGGEWGWNTNNTIRNKPSNWQNPGNGFSTGCSTWGVTTTCIPSGEGGDFSFSLVGRGH